MKKPSLANELFDSIPKWLNCYDNSSLNLSLDQYHSFSSNIPGYTPITLYNYGLPVKMYIQVDNSVHKSTYKTKKVPDESPIKDFNYLNYLQTKQQEEIVFDQERVIKESQWIKKYEPTKFTNLLTDQRNNRIVLSWLKSWDPIVFHKQSQLTQTTKTPTFFNNYNNFKRKNTEQANQNNFNNQEVNHRKLLLLAGPPGCGKTTLARVVAKHCKYQYEEINASDDRTANSLISKLSSMTANESIRSNKSPTFVILDQIDGAMEGDNNGLKLVLNYIETGQLPKEVGVSAKRQVKNKQSKNLKDQVNQGQENQKNIHIKRPVIFICNDPYAKGLKQLRSKAKVIYFNKLETERVVKRLKQVCESEKIYIQLDILKRISQICSNDIRSSLGILELTCRMKKLLMISPKQFLNRLKLSLNKDSQQSINELIWDVFHKKIQISSPNHSLKEMEYRVMKIDNKSLLIETFFTNLHRHKNSKYFGVNLPKIPVMYDMLLYCDFLLKKGFEYNGELEKYFSLPFSLFQIQFKTEQIDRIQFPRAFIDNLNRQKSNQGIIDQLMLKMNPKVLTLINRNKFIKYDLWGIFQCIQPASLKDDDILKCISMMISYGLQFAPHSNNNFKKDKLSLYKPQIQNLFSYGQNKAFTSSVNSSSRTLMENSYQHVKARLSILQHPQYQGMLNSSREPAEIMLKKLTLNSRKRKANGTSKIRYKFQEGSGTQIKVALRLSYFL